MNPKSTRALLRRSTRPRPDDRSRSQVSAPGPSGPHRSASPPLPIPTRARTSALGGYVTGNGVGLGRGAVRRSETFIIPIASCLQGTILALSGSGGGRGEAIRTIYHSAFRDPGADSCEAPNGRQRGSRGH
jgi:hypothetical protein